MGKNCQIDKRQLYSRIFAKKLWVQQISAHICDCEGGFVEAIFFSGWKKKNCLIGSTCVCFCRKTVLPVFNLTRFDWELARFRKRSDTQLINFWRNKWFFYCVECRPPPSGLDKFFVLIDWVGGAAENIVIPRSYCPSVMIESQTFLIRLLLLNANCQIGRRRSVSWFSRDLFGSAFSLWF